MTYKTKGIILKRRNFGEADRILTIYSENEGKITVIAKGVRRTRAKMVGHVELFYELNLQLAEGKNFDILCGAEIINEFSHLRENEHLTNIAYLLSEVLDSLTHENEKNLELYDLLKKSLLRLDDLYTTSEVKSALSREALAKWENTSKVREVVCKSSNRINLLVPYFLYKIFQIQGHEPHSEVCSKCRQKLAEDKNYFSNQFGGVICTNCVNSDLNAQKISSSSIKLMRLFSQNPIEILDKINVDDKIEKELQGILINFGQYIIEKPLKSVRFLL